MATEKNETVELTITHRDGNGAALSRLTLQYPTMDNNTANLVQVDIVRALADLAETWNRAKQGR